MAPAYTVQPMSAADLSLFMRWLAGPDIRQWRGVSDESYVAETPDGPALLMVRHA